jgi:hypothetical protein
MYLRTSLAIVIAVLPSLASANNTHFLPGDCFFFTRLTMREIESLSDMSSPQFVYRSHWNGGRGCGVFGLEFLEIVDMPDSEKAALKAAYQSLADILEPELEIDDHLNAFEGDKTISILIYNYDYDWQRFGIGLQYNEDWADQTAAFGARRDHLVLESFIGTHEPRGAQFIERNWRDSSLVPQLVAEPPALEKGKYVSRAPVKQRAPRLFVVLPNRDFDSYFVPKEGARLCIIRDGSLHEYEFKQRKWQLK